MKNYFFLFASFFFFCACSPSKRDYKKALETNTIEAYEAFLAEHPDGRWADSAKMQVSYLYAIEDGNAQPFRDFLAMYPTSPKTKEVQLQLDSLTNMYGGCMVEAGDLSVEDSIGLEEIKKLVDQKKTSNALKKLFVFLSQDSTRIKDTRHEVQVILTGVLSQEAIAYSEKQVQYVDSLFAYFSGDGFNFPKFSYEIVLCSRLNQLFMKMKQQELSKEFQAARNGMAEIAGYLKNDRRSIGWDEMLGLANYTVGLGNYLNQVEGKLLTQEANMYFKANHDLFFLSKQKLDSCARDQWWQLAATLTDTNYFGGWKSVVTDSTWVQLIYENHTNEKHELIKPLAAKVIEKLQPKKDS